MKALAIFAAVSLASHASGRQPAKPPGKKEVAAQCAEVLNRIKQGSDLPAAAKAAEKVLDEVIAFCPASDVETFREAAFTVRLTRQLSQTPESLRLDLLAFLRANDELAQTLVFLIKPEDKVPAAFTLLDRLRSKHPDLGKHPSLVAALCVVHDQPAAARINENKAEQADALELYEYFVTQRGLVLQPDALPAEVLVSTVDIAATMDEVRWAARKYASDPDIGKRYFDVKYDHDAFRKGTTKKVTDAGFTLPNILSYGGVCADQAHFAAQVGKSLGVPTAYVYGRNAEVSHAWIGYLEVRGAKAAWNFNTGRYEGYKGVRGETADPQTRKRVPDSTLALLADASTTNASVRRAAAAMIDASVRVRDLAKSGAGLPQREGKGTKPGRGTTIADRLELLEAGIRRCPSYAQGWAVLVDAAKAGELTLKDKKRWADVLDRLCAGKYPEFSLDVFRPMVDTVEDVKERDQLWNSLFNGYRQRPDLAAEIRFAQGSMWEKEQDRARAWDCYQDVIQKFADDGPFTVDAARRCEKLLKEADKSRDIAPMYASLWSRLSQPKQMAPEFQTQSNWFRVGMLYAIQLDAAGQGSKADEVRGKLGLPKK